MSQRSDGLMNCHPRKYANVVDSFAAVSVIFLAHRELLQMDDVK